MLVEIIVTTLILGGMYKLDKAIKKMKHNKAIQCDLDAYVLQSTPESPRTKEECIQESVETYVDKTNLNNIHYI